MEFNEVVVKENLGLCRCCLSEGCYKDVCTEYTWMNETEIYAEMLMDCFDISIMQHSDGPNGASRLICEVCITRLRDACNFKKQVQETEKKFIDMISKGEFQPKALQEMKSEVEVEVEPETENTVNAEYLEDEMDFSEAVKEDSDSDYEQPGVSRAATPPKKKRLKKIKIEPPKKGVGIKKVSINKSKGMKQKLANVLTKLIEYTNVIPFKRGYDKLYLCFHCPQQFVESTDLKEHYAKEHKSPIIDYTSPAFNGRTYLKVDITDLSCKICCEPMADLDQFFSHASKAHDLNFEEEYTTKFFEFQLNDKEMKCLKCGMHFKFFMALLRHMHKEHYVDRRAYVCELCDKRFLTQGNLNVHTEAHHRIASHYCKKCDKTFESKQNYRQHLYAEHKAKELKCPHCPELFGSLFLKRRHVAFVHDDKSYQFVCEYCPKMFAQRNARWAHEERVHLKQKKAFCAVCGYQAFNACELRKHNLSHTGVKPYKCTFCDKAYVKNCKLKVHVARHHPDQSK